MTRAAALHAVPSELVGHVVRTTGLSAADAARVVADVVAYFTETTEAFVRRRHGELQARGLTNDEIFGRIAAELPARRFRPPELSLRQLRRLVYG